MKKGNLKNVVSSGPFVLNNDGFRALSENFSLPICQFVLPLYEFQVCLLNLQHAMELSTRRREENYFEMRLRTTLDRLNQTLDMHK